MRISARCDYACRAILELALYWPSKNPLHINSISLKQNIPIRYLVNILIQLKRMGLVASTRGKKGGYSLIKAPSKISLSEVMLHMGGALLPRADSVLKNRSIFTKIWNETEDAFTKVLDKVTFEDISNKARGVKRAIIYQI